MIHAMSAVCCNRINLEINYSAIQPLVVAAVFCSRQPALFRPQAECCISMQLRIVCKNDEHLAACIVNQSVNRAQVTETLECAALWFSNLPNCYGNGHSMHHCCTHPRAIIYHKKRKALTNVENTAFAPSGRSCELGLIACSMQILHSHFKSSASSSTPQPDELPL